jgi:hypothetical protein
MRSRVRVLFLLSLLSLVFATPVAAQFTGTWSGPYQELDENKDCVFSDGPMTLAITQSGNSVAGHMTLESTHDGCSPPFEAFKAIARYTGTIAGNVLTGTVFFVDDGVPGSDGFSFTLSGNTLTLNRPRWTAVLTQTSSAPPDSAATGTYEGTYSASVRPSRCSFPTPITYSGALSGSVWQTGVYLAAAVTAKTAKLIDQQCVPINANLSVFFENVTIAGQQVAGTIWWNDEFSVPFTGTLNGTTLSGSGSDDRHSFTFSLTKTAAPVAPSIASFTATPSTIVAGASTVLSWVVSDATTVSIDNGVGVRPVTGTATVSPAATTAYTLTATGAGGQTAKNTTVTVTPQCPPPTLVITSFPRGMLQPVGGALPTDSYTLTNSGETTATINLTQTGSFFTQSPSSFTLGKSSSQIVTIAATSQPVGFYPGTSSISACGSPTGLSVQIVLRVAAPPPAAIIVTSPDGLRLDLDGPFGSSPGGSALFTNPGASALDGVVVTDVPWINLVSPSLSLAPGATAQAPFSIDRAKRPDAGGLAGAAAGTISFRYINGGTGTAGLAGEVAAQTTAPTSNISVATVAVVDTVKGTTSNQSAPPLGAQLALFVTGASSRFTFGDLVLSNRNPTTAIADLRLYFAVKPGPPTRVNPIGSFPANAAFSFPGVLKSLFSETSNSGTIQIRSAQVGDVSVVQTQVNGAVGKTYGTTLPVFRSDQSFRPGESLFLTGVRKSGTLTTTLYLQEVAGASATVKVDLINAQGTIDGAFLSPIDLAGFAMSELPDFVSGAGITTLRVTNISEPGGGTINAYALVNDSASGDSFAISQLTPAAGADPLFAPAFAGEGRLMTLHLANASASAPITISATAVTGPPPPARRRAATASPEIVTANGLSPAVMAVPAIAPLGYHLLTVPESGFVKLAGSTSLRVAGRHTLPRTGGTIGTTVPVVAGSAALALNGKTRFAGIEEASPSTAASARPLTYQTNLMLVETTGTGSAQVSLTLRFIFAAAKTTSSVVVDAERTVPAGGFTMIQGLGRSIIGPQRAMFGNLQNAILDIEVIGGSGAVIPFLQAIDNGTGDVIIRHQ